MKKTSSHNVIPFGTARASAAQPHAVANSNARSGYLEAWLKNHDDSQSLIRENLSLKDQKKLLEDERQELLPSVPEHVLYYVSIGFGLLLAVSWLVGSFYWETL